jgi:hypothetical protein
MKIKEKQDMCRIAELERTKENTGIQTFHTKRIYSRIGAKAKKACPQSRRYRYAF